MNSTKHLLALMALAMSLVSCAPKTQQDLYSPYLIAHRGCHLDNLVPENTLYAIRMAKAYGYKAIELDARLTTDSVMVCFHDWTLERVLRNAADYSPIEERIRFIDLSYDELKNYVYQSDDPDMRCGVTRFEDMLECCKQEGIVPLLHCEHAEPYAVAQQILPDGWIGFTSSDEVAKAARRASANTLILLDPGKDTTTVIERLKAIGGRCGMSTMSLALQTEELCCALKAEGYEFQSSILPAPKEIIALRNGLTILLTDFGMYGTTLQPSAFYGLKDFGCKASGTPISEGKSISYTAPYTDFGGILADISFKGEIKVILNGVHEYVLSSDEISKESMSMRFHHQAPSVEIVALKDSYIESVGGKLYVADVDMNKIKNK